MKLGIKQNDVLSPARLILKPRQRLLLWTAIRGMWKNKKPDPIKELNKMRREWDRKLPPLK